MSKESSSKGGVSGLTLLGILFIGLKLTGYIDWSWWYVTLPLWGGLALGLSILCIVGLVWLITKLFFE